MRTIALAAILAASGAPAQIVPPGVHGALAAIWVMTKASCAQALALKAEFDAVPPDDAEAAQRFFNSSDGWAVLFLGDYVAGYAAANGNTVAEGFGMMRDNCEGRMQQTLDSAMRGQ